MMDYFTAYRLRREKVQEVILDMAKQLKDKGARVWAPKSGLIAFIHIELDGKQCTWGFTDVPYRWYIHVDIDIRQGKGSGVYVSERHGTENEYSVHDIIDSMKPIPYSIFKNRNSHLKELE